MPDMPEQAYDLVQDVPEYREQYCGSCREETDQQVEPGLDLATCLRCGTRNRVLSEEERVAALIRRLHDDELATLGRLRTAVVPGF